MIAYIQAGESAGEFHIKFLGNWLEPAEAQITVQ